MAQAERVRKAIGTLLTDLPELADYAAARVSPRTNHAAVLADLLGAARRVAGYWPGLDGSLRKFAPRARWQLTADCVAGAIWARWRRANPGRTIGKPLSAEQPMTRALVDLLALAGHPDLNAAQVAQHFSRDQFGRTAFVMIEAENS